MPPGVAVAALFISAASAVHSAQQAKKVSRARREQNKVSNATERIKLEASRRQQLREERVRRAQILQASENTGVAGSSGAHGSISNLSTRIGGNLAIQTSGVLGTTGINNLSSDIAGYKSRQATAQAVGSFSSTVFQGAGGFGTIFPE